MYFWDKHKTITSYYELLSGEVSSAAPRSPYRHLELCGIALITLYKINVRLRAVNAAGPHIFVCRRI